MIINQFFEDAEDNLKKGYGYGSTGVMWYNEQGTYGTTPLETVKTTWTQRPDIKWFPSTPIEDRPTLPKVFDLIWDVKTPRELKVKLRDACRCQREDIQKAMDENNIKLDGIDK